MIKKKFLLHTKIIFIAFILTLTLPSVFADNNLNSIISVKYIFCEPEIIQLTQNHNTYDKVLLEDAQNLGIPGEPNLPVYGAYILIPPKCNIKNIRTEIVEKDVIKIKNKIIPGVEPIPTSQIGKKVEISFNSAIYNSDEIYPQELYKKVGTYFFRGYEILVLQLFPIQYQPLSNEILYHNEMTVILEISKNKNDINPLFRNSIEDENELIKKVDNPRNIFEYKKIKRTCPLNEQYDLLILTTDEFKDGFEPLKQAHDAIETKTLIRTLSGADCESPQIIREFIHTIYMEHQIEHLLIGGDYDKIIAPFLQADESIPSDLYYACLDGTYDNDGDGILGEKNDGPNGSDVDLIAEVYVGRACVGNITEVQYFVNKTIKYLNLTGEEEYLKRVVMAGEWLQNPSLLGSDETPWGGMYMDQLINESDANGYFTIGIPSENYSIHKLYDMDFDPPCWSKQLLIDQINIGTYFINHLGHATPGRSIKLNIENVDALVNENLFFVYSQGCNSGAFDNRIGYDCIAEHFTVKSEYAAFAGLWNSRTGWFDPLGTDGPNQHYHREFFDAIYYEKKLTIGGANHDSKEDNIHIINTARMRSVYYELTLFGDPALSFIIFDGRHWNEPPEKPQKPIGSEEGKIGEEYTYTTSTTDPDVDDILYYMWDWGNETFSEWIGPYESGEEAQASNIWSEQGSYEIRVKAKDRDGNESEWSEPLPVIMPRNKNTIIDMFLQFLEGLIDRFPVLGRFFPYFIL